MRNLAQREPHHVVMLAFEDAQMLDITGPLEVFSRTSRWLRDNLGVRGTPYSVEMVAERAGPVRMSSGLKMTAERSCFEISRADTLLVAGGVGHEAAMRNRPVLNWLRQAASESGRVGSIGNGASILAAAGLLDGRRATTHWAFCDRLTKEVVGGRILPDAIYVRDGNLYTSAGVTAAMDLALALVEEDWGRSLALRVAQDFVMYLVRPGGQAQFSGHLKAQQREGPLGALELWILEHLSEPLSLQRLAEAIGMSNRHFSRKFTDQFGLPPMVYVARARFDRALSELEESPNVRIKELARRCGFSSEQNLRRAFNRMMGMSPEEYRARIRKPKIEDPACEDGGLPYFTTEGGMRQADRICAPSSMATTKPNVR